jgi:hypothetical protein
MLETLLFCELCCITQGDGGVILIRRLELKPTLGCELGSRLV